MKYDLNLIKHELETLPDYKAQIYLQGDHLNMVPFEPTKGDNYLVVDQTESDYSVPLFNLPYINSIINEHNLVRTRVMRMKPKTCYYWHHDFTKRLHIPVITHDHCFLLIDNEKIHLPADGSAYIVDTTQMHTALNCSKIDRIHIVGCFQ